jgi:predicted LPLAT superfamily acyltransferase
MKLHELHVDELSAGAVGERMAIARAFPAVARNLVGASDAARREHNRLGRKRMEPAALAVVRQHARHMAIVHQEFDDRVFHVYRDAQVHRVILQRSDQLETGAVTHVREARITVPPKFR